MRYLEKPREFDRLPLVALRSLLILSASSVSLCLGVPAQAQSAVPPAAVEPPPVVRTIGTDGPDTPAPTTPPHAVPSPAVRTDESRGRKAVARTGSTLSTEV